jgi:hypothetical protein
VRPPNRAPAVQAPPVASRRLTLDLDATASQLHGELRDEHGDARAFSGWLGLAAALEQTLDADVRADEPEIQATTPSPRRRNHESPT